MKFLQKIFSSQEEKYLKKISKDLPAIENYKKKFENLQTEEFAKKTKELKEETEKGVNKKETFSKAIALACVASKKAAGLNPFDVQILGGISLNDGSIAEMRTGEGKTLVAVIPAYLRYLAGDKVHIITVNDYLSRRDAVWIGQIFSLLGLSVGVINGAGESYSYDKEHTEIDEERDAEGSYKVFYEFLKPIERKVAYEKDILYGTNNEFAFDYLRDNIEYKKENLKQKSLDFAIIDEVDSILIDEARNPLIISSPANIPDSQYRQFSEFANKFNEEDYEIDEKQKAISLTKEGVDKLESLLGVKNIFIEGGERYIHYMQNALKAKALFIKNKQYIVKDGVVVIVDEFTGRLQPGRQWSEGLHQAIEAKEGVKINQESRTYASITYQNYFKLYKQISGMTGTAKSSEEEFYKVYGLPVISIPTNKEVKRIDKNDLIYQTKKGKLNAIVEKTKELNKKGQPILIGTSSIESNEELSKLLTKNKIKHQLLNAKNHENEGSIIANAGAKNSVTIATNLAGRGVDIKLGGAETVGSKHLEEKEEVKKLGGLFVIGTERHESRRIDNQLRGRSGRQGDVGETQFFLSLEDDLVRVFGGERMASITQTLGMPEDMPIENRLITRTVENAQKKIEGHYFDARRFSLQYDNVLNVHRKEIYKKRANILLAEKEEDFSEFVNQDLYDKLKEKLGDEYIEKVKMAILTSIDRAWMEHLELMDYAKTSSNLRTYGQRDPLMEYKREGIKLFQIFMKNATKNFDLIVGDKLLQ